MNISVHEHKSGLCECFSVRGHHWNILFSAFSARKFVRSGERDFMSAEGEICITALAQTFK